MAAVTSNNRPAPFPKSEMAGIISPMIMSGMAKVRKLPNSPLKVTNIRATGTGRNCPSAIPVTMAMRTCHRREIRNFFITLMLLAKIGKYSLFVKEMQRYLLQKYSILIDEKVGRNYVCADILGRSVLP